MAIPLPNRFGEGGQAAEFTHSILVFPPVQRAVVWRLVKYKYGKDTGHLDEVVFSLTETLLQFDTVQNQRDLYPLGVPVRAIRRGGYVRIVYVLFGKVPTHPCVPSERCHIARRRPFLG